MSDTNEETTPEAGGDIAAVETTVEGDELQRQRDEYYDRLLRKTAEFDNYRKRVERDRQSMAESTAADLVRDLLPLVDDLERALRAQARSEDAAAYRAGVELIHRQLLEVLRKRGVRQIDALGADFDPHYHEAVSYDAAPGHRDGEIIEELGRGYMLGDRLIRPSIVKVAKGA